MTRFGRNWGTLMRAQAFERCSFRAFTQEIAEGDGTTVNVKEYLSQTLEISRDIDSKLEQLKELRALATKASATVTDMPGSPTRNTDKLESVVLKIVAQEEAINREIDRLVDLREEIAEIIRQERDGKTRRILELRYLCCKPWHEVAAKMELNPRYVYRLHDTAVRNLKNFVKSHQKPSKAT